jgi:hypothetical protein
MPEPRDARSIIEAAEQSAAAGDYASAERLLREAAGVQETTLGPFHPDLANTLNNLGVVCEMNHNAVDAEDCFRRAYAIATAALTPDHPFVATSRQNLRDFCEARGKPLELPVSPVVERRQSPSNPEPGEVQPLIPTRFIRPLAIGGLGPAVMLIVILTAVRPWLNSDGRAQSPPPVATQSPSPVATQSPSPIATDPARETPVEPSAPVAVERTARPEENTRISEQRRLGKPARGITEASSPVRLTVIKARLCADLEDFACDPPDRPIPAGPLFFYTQVKSMTPTTIQHRWYRDNRLYQTVALHVQASPVVGYRTYSRNIMTRESAGDWRVELRTEDGVLLHEERFSVR